MNVTLSEDEVRLLLQLLQGTQGNLMAPDAIATCRLVQGLAKKLTPKKSLKKKGK